MNRAHRPLDRHIANVAADAATAAASALLAHAISAKSLVLAG